MFIFVKAHLLWSFITMQATGHMISASMPETPGTVVPSHFLVVLPQVWPASEDKVGHEGWITHG